jgi:hypothetical protein
MRWKQLRKKVKDDDVADGIDLDDVDDLLVEADAAAATPGEADGDDDDSPSRARKTGGPVLEAPIPPLPWSTISFFPYASDIPSVLAIEDEAEDGGGSTATELGPLPGSTSNPWLMARLVKNDERTKGMTAEEYATWSECRSASFTYRKKKTFREWCGLGVVADYRSTDDVLEVLGFLTSEWVQSLTEGAIAVQAQEARAADANGGNEGVVVKRNTVEGPFSSVGVKGGESRNGRNNAGNAELPSRSPIQPRHVRRAFEQLQTPPKRYRAMLNGTTLRRTKRPRLVSYQMVLFSPLCRD